MLRGVVNVLAFIVGALSIIIGLLSSYPSAQQFLTYANWINIDFYKNLKDPRSLRIHGARNIVANTKDGLKIYGWHLIPTHQCLAVLKDCDDNDEVCIEAAFDKALAGATSVIVYLHGNATSRGTRNRVDLIKTMAAALNSHIVVFDYRGFGDSEGWPSESGLILDGIAMWEWAVDRAGNESSLFIYGQSLGTAVGISLTSKLNLGAGGKRKPSGLILDAPFTDLKTAAKEHPSTAFLRAIPGVYEFLSTRMVEKWDNIGEIENLKNIPVLILHGEKDGMMSHSVGYELHSAVLNTLGKGSSTFVSFAEGGHKNLFTFPLWVKAVGQFMAASSLK